MPRLVPAPLCIALLLALEVAGGLPAERLQAQEAEQPSASVNETLDRFAVALGGEIERELGKASSVQLGGFEGPISDVGIKLALKRELQKRVNLVTEGANFTISGEFAGGMRNQQMMIRVTTRIKKAANGTVLRTIPFQISVTPQVGFNILNPPTFDASVAGSEESGGTANPPATGDNQKPSEMAEADQKKVSERLTNSVVDPEPPTITKPTAFIGEQAQDSLMKISAESPYGLELLRETPEGYVPLLAKVVGDRAKIDLSAGQVYAVRVHNGSDQPVGVEVLIDGINIFAFSADPVWKESGKFIVRPGTGLLKGWHDEGAKSHKFQVMKYADSPAAELGFESGVGTIQVGFYQVAPVKADGDNPVLNLATGKGDQTEMRYSKMLTKFGGFLGGLAVDYVPFPQDLPQ